MKKQQAYIEKRNPYTTFHRAINNSKFKLQKIYLNIAQSLKIPQKNLITALTLKN